MAPLATTVLRLFNKQQSSNSLTINVVLDAPTTGQSATTQVNGKAIITALSDTRFDDIQIKFVGNAATTVARTIAVPGGQSQGKHCFLIMDQRNLRPMFPSSNQLRTSESLTLPFNFTLPSCLPSRSCTHEVEGPAVREGHLLLPPSLNDGHASRTATAASDDLAPSTARICYRLKIAVLEKDAEDPLWFAPLAEISMPIHVSPVTQQSLPLYTSVAERAEISRTTKELKKSSYCHAVGSLTAYLLQPPGLSLDTGYGEEGNAMAADVFLHFNPAFPESPPPRLKQVTSALKATTYFSSKGMADFPNDIACLSDISQHRYSAKVQKFAFTCNVSGWKEHGNGGDVNYSTKVTVPVVLPSNKHMLPSFCSCLISRQYTLQVRLYQSSVQRTPLVEVEMPIQIYR
ncbi:Hypothetical protein R9X50_00557600 [Acrodontium crateriforme]|uniref:Bul1 C-terminal domain-containing protein n=1 Tax=Acrodontium crateriforme TaxID=150365 RepID=A0AAQ3M9L6_9PEZI|nr:Hypothetical protein R9X50_00557600 [Acrodontium crateriforme]